MEKAFVLINCEPGQEPSILKQLQKIEDVVEAQGIYGMYDIVARVESDSQSQLNNIILDQIRKLNYLKSTQTLIPTEHEGELENLIPDLIPDVIPEEKKPLEVPFSEEEEEDYDEADEEKKLN